MTSTLLSTNVLLVIICQVILSNCQKYTYDPYGPQLQEKVAFNPDPEADIYTDHGVPYPGTLSAQSRPATSRSYSSRSQPTYRVPASRRAASFQRPQRIQTSRRVSSTYDSRLRRRPYAAPTRVLTQQRQIYSRDHGQLTYQRPPSQPIVPRYSDLGIKASQIPRHDPYQGMYADPTPPPSAHFRPSSSSMTDRHVYKQQPTSTKYSSSFGSVDYSGPALPASAWQTVTRQHVDHGSQISFDQHHLDAAPPGLDLQIHVDSGHATSHYQVDLGPHMSGPDYRVDAAQHPGDVAQQRSAQQYQADPVQQISATKYQTDVGPQIPETQYHMDAISQQSSQYQMDTGSQYQVDVDPRSATHLQMDTPPQYQADAARQVSEPRYQTETAPHKPPTHLADADHKSSGPAYQVQHSRPVSEQTERKIRERPMLSQGYRQRPSQPYKSEYAPSIKAIDVPNERAAKILPQKFRQDQAPALDTVRVATPLSDQARYSDQPPSDSAQKSPTDTMSRLPELTIQEQRKTSKTTRSHPKENVMEQKDQLNPQNIVSSYNRAPTEISSDTMSKSHPSMTDQHTAKSKLSKALEPSVPAPSHIPDLPLASEFVASNDVKRTKIPMSKSKSEVSSATKNEIPAEQVPYDVQPLGLNKGTLDSILRDYNLTATGSVFLTLETRRRNAVALQNVVRRRRPRRRGGRRKQ